MATDDTLPLAGVRIVSLESFVSAPYGTMLLAGLGAEVIKIEHAQAGGDATRSIGADPLGPADSCYFQSLNLNKRSISLDISSPAGRQRLDELLRSADALVENLRGHKALELGLDYASLKSINRSLVCLHISGYGRTNERMSWPGFDYLMQAEAGLMSLTGEPGTPPTRFGVSMVDSMTGTVAVVGLLAALRRASATGNGCDVDTNLFDVAVHQLSYAGTWALNNVPLPGRQPNNAHQALAPVQTFRTADGWIFVMCMTQGFWEELVGALDVNQFRTDARFSTMRDRKRNLGQLNAELQKLFERQSTQAWMRRLGGIVPVAPVLDVHQAVSTEFVEASGMIEEIAHPKSPAMKVLGYPIRLDGRRPVQQPAPALAPSDPEVPQV